MPLPGGAADKFGNRYEGLWTIDSMIDLIDEQADIIEIESVFLNELEQQAIAIRLEPPGEEGEGVEFWIQREKSREYHQVKRQNTDGQWTLATLRSNNILHNFKNKLGNEQAHCYFVSINNAYQLYELAERAKGSQSWLEFAREFIGSNTWQTIFSELVEYWSQYQKVEIKQAIDNFKRSISLNNKQQLIIADAKETYENLK